MSDLPDPGAAAGVPSGADPAGSAALDALDPALLVPYGRWRRWVRALRVRGGRRREHDAGGDRAYLAYGATLLALMYLPVGWVAVQQAGLALTGPAVAVPGGGTGAGAGTLVAVGAALVAAAALGASALPRVGLPLAVAETDARFVLTGVWRARTVLWRRGVLALALAALVGGLVGSALAAAFVGGPQDGIAPVALAAWTLCAAGFSLAPVAVGVAGQGSRRRSIGLVAVVGLVVVAVAAALGGAELVADPTTAPACVGGLPAACASSGPPALVAGAAVLVAATSSWLVLAVLPETVDPDTAAAAGATARTTGVGLAAGEAAGLRPVIAPPRRGVPGRLPGVLLPHVPLVARDVLGLWRRRRATGTALLVGAAGAFLVAAHGGVLVTVVGALLLYGAAAAWTRGLDATAAHPVPGGLLPHRPGRLLTEHAVVPTVAGVVVAVAGLATAAGVGAASAAPAVAVVAVAVLGARVGVAGATTVPPGLFTPVAGPAGDVSPLVVGAWYLRGWLVVAAVAWATVRSWPLAVVLVAGVVTWAAAGAVHRLARS
ncbi:hypothetical protein ATJ88_1186 [Isoptericola jiangsuensis]|uniref:Uncharacterized protein n=1 Tax=Isoptericola jiangsuensis TaxID=548579 RepID=A0A2A9EU26_9MICO|nr:hypothetical protein [Isoptericola jiangsuensis]PFG42524.1 hypothetical protein ATJ88_1186 [Isoptericola jiangsuensis]